MSIPPELRIWSAPAKVNLFLNVVGRRPDGYHELQTIFQYLSLRDRLAFEILPNGAIELAEELPGVKNTRHLCVRAARALAEASGSSHGARIHLEKHIPIGSGLGGGSSDAATTLVALNILWDLGLDTDALLALALELGADVPIFVSGRAAWGEGIGERLTPVALPRPWYVIIHPNCSVATVDVFQDSQLTRNSPRIKIPGSLLRRGEVPTIEGLLALAGNDCQAVAVRRYPVLAEALAWLSGHGSARMTGTGAALFAAFDSERKAKGVLDRVPCDYWAMAARGENESPLLREVNDF